MFNKMSNKLLLDILTTANITIIEPLLWSPCSWQQQNYNFSGAIVVIHELNYNALCRTVCAGSGIAFILRSLLSYHNRNSCRYFNPPDMFDKIISRALETLKFGRRFSLEGSRNNVLWFIVIALAVVDCRLAILVFISTRV